jgi:hypothetical protein
MSGGNKNQKKSHQGIAHIIAVNMGFGHERPARVMNDFFNPTNNVIIANDYKGIPTKDKKLWENGRTFYETISRYKNLPIIGTTAFKLLDELQKVTDFYPRRDLSSPNLQLRQFYYLIRSKNLMRHLIDHLSENPLPLISTFMTPAFAAEEFGYPEEIFCLCTDSDISRTWAPLKPKSSRIKYLAPTGRVAERLKLYGVPENNIHLTGFPLPHENIGGIDSKILLSDLQRRICNLDPHGYFVNHTGLALNAYLGPQYCHNIQETKPHPVKLAFAIGGAGAQLHIVEQILRSLKPSLLQDKIRLDLIVGIKPEINKKVQFAIKSIGLKRAIENGSLGILFEPKREEYFQKFTELIRKIDILWTKPSELSFYAGLGIPIIMAPTIGSQEDFNRRWLMHIGAGLDQYNPKFVNEWLFDWINSGALARNAWNGYIEAPTHGLYRIEQAISGKNGEIHDLPLII